jgi:hypothetical protein
VKDYHSKHAVTYVEPENTGFTSIEVLHFLKGRKWDEIALGYVHAVRPSSIRVTTGVQTLDAYSWRVTVFVDENDTIERITQEVEVGLYGNVEDGHHLDMALQHATDSEIFKFYVEDPDDPTESYIYGFGSITKVLQSGKMVTFRSKS